MWIRQDLYRACVRSLQTPTRVQHRLRKCNYSHRGFVRRLSRVRRVVRASVFSFVLTPISNFLFIAFPQLFARTPSIIISVSTRDRFLRFFLYFWRNGNPRKKKRNQKDNQKCIELKKPAQGFSLKVKRAIVSHFAVFLVSFFFFFLFRYKLKFSTLVPFLIITSIFSYINGDQNLFSCNWMLINFF